MSATELTIDQEQVRKRNQLYLVTLFAIAFVPLIVSTVVFFYFPQLLPTSTKNEGQLISPSVAAEQIGLEGQIGKWTLLLPVGASCDAECEERLYLARQVNIALGRESSRVQRMAIWTEGTAPAQKIQADYPGLGAFPVELEKFKAKLGDPNRIYLMDPLGNILMFYTLDKAGKPMLKDIKFLLKNSTIG